MEVTTLVCGREAVYTDGAFPATFSSMLYITLLARYTHTLCRLVLHMLGAVAVVLFIFSICILPLYIRRA